MARRNRRTEIINAARQLFYAQGYENTSTREIIRIAGVSFGAFYHHFESKEALLMVVIDPILAELRAATARLLTEPALTAVSRYQRLVAADNDFRVTHSQPLEHIWFVMQSDDHLRLVHYLSQKGEEIYLPALNEIIQQGVDDGAFDVKFVPQTANLLLSICRATRVAIAKIWQNHLQFDDPAAAVEQELDAAQIAIDRLVGAALGELLLLDRQNVLDYFATLKPT